MQAIGVQPLPTGNRPDANGFVCVMGGQGLIIRAKGKLRNGRGMVSQHVLDFLRLQIPQVDKVIYPPRGQPLSIGRNGKLTDRAGMSHRWGQAESSGACFGSRGC